MTLARRYWIVGFLWLTLASIGTGCARPLPAVGLRPLPLLMRGWTRDPLTRELDSVKPTLRWEAFPRPEDLEADTEGRLAGVRGATYELRIWRAEGDFPAELVYARAGLPEPVHTVETPLAPDTLYLWTVRARFELDGHSRVNQWGFLGFWTFRSTMIPPPDMGHFGYYRMKTPKTMKQ